MTRRRAGTQPTAAAPATRARRVRFERDEDAQFEECNGESRPLTEEEYAENSYMGCPRHPRGYKGDRSQDATSKAEPGRGVCACGRLYEPIPYTEYLAYYGNPDCHVYLGCIVEEQCPGCKSWSTADSLWRIDCMTDDRQMDAITLGDAMSEADARKLPGYLGEVAGELLGNPQKIKRPILPAAIVRQIRAVLWDTAANDWRELQSCADAIQEITLILDKR